MVWCEFISGLEKFHTFSETPRSSPFPCRLSLSHPFNLTISIEPQQWNQTKCYNSSYNEQQWSISWGCKGKVKRMYSDAFGVGYVKSNTHTQRTYYFIVFSDAIPWYPWYPWMYLIWCIVHRVSCIVYPLSYISDIDTRRLTKMSTKDKLAFAWWHCRYLEIYRCTHTHIYLYKFHSFRNRANERTRDCVYL